jgi:hypothetical protein
MQVTIRAQLNGRFLRQHAILAHDTQRPAVPARTTAIRQKRVLFDEDRILGLDQLDRNVCEIADAVRAAVLAIAVRTATLTGIIVELQVEERLPLLALVAGEHDRKLRAAGACDAAVGQEPRRARPAPLSERENLPAHAPRAPPGSAR